MSKEQFLEKHNLTEADYRNLVRFEKARRTGKVNMFSYLEMMSKFEVNGGKKIADWIQAGNNYEHFLEIYNEEAVK